MIKAGTGRERLDMAWDLGLMTTALADLAERCRQQGDHGTDLLARDANEALYALLLRLEYLEATVPVRDVRSR